MSDLYLLGDQQCLAMKRIAVVGSRNMSEYGRQVTVSFVKKLVASEWCIVSGLARGIDRVAHETALNYKGRTLAVLGHGLGECYPKEHETLKQNIVSHGGLLVSAYDERVKATPDQVRERDMLMAQLSQVILVAECPRKSGAKITVSAAAELGKNVYVIPGPINQESYHWSVEIIRNGGIPVYSPDDLIGQLSYTT